MLEYKEIDELVMKCQAERDKDATQKLLDNFEWFIEIYLELICEGKISLENKSARKFISLFMRNRQVAKKMHLFRRSTTVVKSAFDSGEYLKNTYSFLERDDIHHLLIIEFLELVHRYKPKDNAPRFVAYVMSSYHFRVYHSLTRHTKNHLYHSDLEGLLLDKKTMDRKPTEKETEIEDKFDNKYPELTSPEDIFVDENWVAGFTSTNVFDELTYEQRKILKLSYVDGLTDTEISHVLGTCRATVNRRRLRVVDMLRTYAENLNYLD